jgi:hypothetical protein
MMDSRLIFLRNLVVVELREDGEGQSIRVVDVPVQSRRCVPYDEKAGQLSPRADGERVSAKSMIPCFQEKSRRETTGFPYRKPTQVGEEKILRRMRELSPRNSAN